MAARDLLLLPSLSSLSSLPAFSPLSVLYDDIWCLISVHCDPRAILRFARVSKECYRLANLMFRWRYHINPSAVSRQVKTAILSRVALFVDNGITDIRVLHALCDQRSNKLATILLMAFESACMTGHADVVKLLLADGQVYPAANNNWAIYMASGNGHAEVVKLLLADKRVNPAADGNSAFHLACRKGYLKVVKLLLADERVNPADNDNEVIQRGCASGQLELVTLLLADKRVDPAANDNYAIREASCRGHVEVVKLLLLDRRVNPATRNNEAIILASQLGYVEVVKLLLADPRVDGNALLINWQ